MLEDGCSRNAAEAACLASGASLAAWTLLERAAMAGGFPLPPLAHVLTELKRRSCPN
jgi:hypothetical protein